MMSRHARVLWIILALIISGALPLAVSSQPSPAPQPVVLGGYRLIGSGSSSQYAWAKYTPRGFVNQAAVDPFGDWQVTDAGVYTGWDVLAPPHPASRSNESHFVYVYTTDNWLHVRLNRSAQVGIAWMGETGIPDWLASWPKSGSVQINKKAATVYLKSFPAGDVQFGSYGINNGWGGPYVVIFGEIRDDVPSNQPCPQWLHNQWVTKGPDGKLYRTWHPQIDPVYWCYYQHEHGADPVQLGINYHPLYDLFPGGAAYPEQTVVPSEEHVGFKSYSAVSNDGTKWYVTQHMGSAEHHRICARFHTVEVYVADASGNRLADLSFSGDFGQSIAFDGTDTPLTPTDCPDQANVNSSGVRKIPGYYGNSDYVKGPYEPWRIGELPTAILGLDLKDLTFATVNPIGVCPDYRCDTLTDTHQTGAERFIQFYPGTRVDAALLNHAAGTFYTNPYGTELRNGDEPDAVQQYIAPGTHAEMHAAKCKDFDGFGAPWTCGDTTTINALIGDAERENSIESLN